MVGSRSKASANLWPARALVHRSNQWRLNVTDTSKIQEHMEVRGSDGQHVGTVDHLEGTDRIKLTKSDAAAGGQHHLIPVAWIDHVDAHVHLNVSSADAKQRWEQAA